IIEGFGTGLFALLPLTGDDLPAVAAIMGRYEDAGIQFADATLAHLAEREGVRTVFTTDRRDFSIIRLKRNRPLKIIPDTQCPNLAPRHLIIAADPVITREPQERLGVSQALFRVPPICRRVIRSPLFGQPGRNSQPHLEKARHGSS